MVRRSYFLFVITTLVAQVKTPAQTTAPKDAQAVTIVRQSLIALTGGTSVTDATLQATASYIAGSDQETGTATLLAKAGESRITLTLSGGQRAEVRNNSSGAPQGSWSGPDGAWHAMALHNCWVDAAWFFPALTFATALNDPQVALVYVGQESRGGLAVQHVQVSRVLSGQIAGVVPLVQKLSSMDLYLDAVSSLPVAFDFNVHPDDDAGTNIPVEIQFANYRPLSGMQVPFHIQKYFQFSLLVDLNLTSVTVNSGIPQTEFAVQ